MQMYLEEFRKCKSGLANSYIALVADTTLQDVLSEQVLITGPLLYYACETRHWCLLHSRVCTGRIMASLVSVRVQDSTTKKEEKEKEC